MGPQVKEHYLNLIEDAVRELPSLVNLNLGTLVNNGILRIVSKTCPRYWWLSKCKNITLGKDNRLSRQ